MSSTPLGILKDRLSYCPDTGVFAWLVDTGKVKAGEVAGSNFCPNGKDNPYVQIKLAGKQYLAHRLAFLYMTGRWPSEIDHIDGIGANNSWYNLREVSRRENCRNHKLHSNNSSGKMGVIFYKRTNSWMSRIKVDSKNIHLGYYNNLEDAIAARESAERYYGFHSNHGRATCL